MKSVYNSMYNNYDFYMQRSEKMGSRGKKKSDMRVAKCVACCYINGQNKRTLPCLCPSLDMPCFAIVPKWVENENNLLDFMVGISNHECNKDIADEDEPRVPMDSEYIDKAFLDRMEQSFKECQSKGIRVEIMESY